MLKFKKVNEDIPNEDHPDFEKNTILSKHLVSKFSGKPCGFRVYIADSELKKQNLLWFVFSPPLGINESISAYCVNLNQKKEDFSNEAKRAYLTILDKSWQTIKKHNLDPNRTCFKTQLDAPKINQNEKD